MEGFFTVRIIMMRSDLKESTEFIRKWKCDYKADFKNPLIISWLRRFFVLLLLCSEVYRILLQSEICLFFLRRKNLLGTVSHSHPLNSYSEAGTPQAEGLCGFSWVIFQSISHPQNQSTFLKQRCVTTPTSPTAYFLRTLHSLRNCLL